MNQSGNQSQGRLPELDGLRAISVLLVITVHMHDHIWSWLNGWQGVTIFFVLSGYLITTLALREEDRTGGISLKAFYIRRVMRLFPLYYIVLGIYCFLIFGVGMNPEKRATLENALPYFLTYLQEVPFVYGVRGESATLPFFHSWSLGIEEKFYLVWPLLAFVALASAKHFRIGTAIVLVVIFAAIPGGRGWGGLLHPYYHILVGCLLGLLLHDSKWRARIVSPLSSRSARIAVVMSFLAVHFAQPHLRGAVAVVAGIAYTLAAGALVALVIVHDGRLRRVLQVRALAFLGTLSYGIYLVHVLALNAAEKVFHPGTGIWLVSLAALLTACLISIAIAYALHVTIEQRCIDLGRRWSQRFIRPRVESERRISYGSTRTDVGG